MDRWYDVRGTVVAVSISSVVVDPESATAPGSKINYLTDGTQSAWGSVWDSRYRVGASCHTSSMAPKITIEFPPSRIKNLVIYAGTPEAQENRFLQFRPRTLNYSFDGSDCRTATLMADGTREVIPVDSGLPVSTLEFVVSDTFDPPDGGINILSITDFALEARP